MQEAAERAFRDGLMRFAGGKGWRDPGLSIDVSDDWRGQPAAARLGAGFDDWRAAGGLPKEGDTPTPRFIAGSPGTPPPPPPSMPNRPPGTPPLHPPPPRMTIPLNPPAPTT